jgi:hypothetical protein
MQSDWQSNLTDFNSISDDNATFVYNQCREYLINTTENLKYLKNKITLTLAFIFSVISFSAPVILNSKSGNYDSDYVTFLIVINTIYLGVALFLVIFALYPKANAVSGNEPQNLLEQNFLQQNYKTIQLLEAETYQLRINYNINLTDKIAKWLKGSLIVLIFSTLLGVIFAYYPW